MADEDAKPKFTPEELAARRAAALERAAAAKAAKAAQEAPGGTPTAADAGAEGGSASGAASAAAATKPLPKKEESPVIPIPADPFDAVVVRAGVVANDKKANAWPFPPQHHVPSDESLEELREIADHFPGMIVAVGRAARHPVAYVKPASWRDIVRYCKDTLGYDHLSFVSAADYPDDKDPTKALLEMHAQLWSHRRKRDLIVKAHIPRTGKDCQIASLVPLFEGANWHEREAYDMFGIRFTGHPYMARIFLPEGWQGHPLLKDYNEKEQFIGLGEDGEDVVYDTPGPNRW